MIERIKIKGFSGFPKGGVTVSFEEGRIKFLERKDFKYRTIFMKFLSVVKNFIHPTLGKDEVVFPIFKDKIFVDISLKTVEGKFKYTLCFDEGGIIKEGLEHINDEGSKVLFKLSLDSKKKFIKLSDFHLEVSENLDFAITSNLNRRLSLLYVIRRINYKFGFISVVSNWFLNYFHTDLIDNCLKNGGYQLFGSYYNSNANSDCNFSFINKFLRYVLDKPCVTLIYYSTELSILSKESGGFKIKPNYLSSEELYLIDLGLYLSKSFEDKGLCLIDDFDMVLSEKVRKRVLNFIKTQCSGKNCYLLSGNV